MLQAGIKGVQIGSKQKVKRNQLQSSTKQASINDAMCGQSPIPKSSIQHHESFDSNMQLQKDQEKRTRVQLGAEGEINLLKKEPEDATPGLTSEVEDHRASLLFNNQGEASSKNQQKTVTKNENLQIQVKSGSASISSVRGAIRSNTTFVQEFDDGVISSGKVINITSQHQIGYNRDMLNPVASNQFYQQRQGASKIQGLMKQPQIISPQAQFTLTGTKKNISGAHQKKIPNEKKNSGTGQPSSCLVSQSPVKLGSKYSLSGSRENSPTAHPDLKNKLMIKEQPPMTNLFDDSQPSISQSQQKVDIPKIDEAVNVEREQDDVTHENPDGTFRAPEMSYSVSGKVGSGPFSPASQANNMKTDKSDLFEVRAKEVQIVDINQINMAKQSELQNNHHESQLRTPMSHERKQTEHESIKSTGMQSNQAKRGLQALETSGEDIGPILQDIKMMQQIGQTSGSEGRESPNPAQWKQESTDYQIQTSLFNITQTDQQPKQEMVSTKSPRVKEIIINADQIPMKVSRKGLKGHVSPRSSQGNTSVERAMTADRNTQRDSKISKEEVFNTNDRNIISGNGLVSQQGSIRHKRNGSVVDNLRPKNMRQMQKSAQAKRSTNHHTSGGHRKKPKDDFEPQARSRRQPGLFNALSDRGAFNFHPGTVDIISKENNSAFGGTVTSEDFSANLDQNFIDKISKSQNNFAKKICKNANLGVVYNQITIERSMLEKKHFAEVALKNTFLPGQKNYNEKFQQLANQLKDEQEIQEMNCKAFLRYLELNPKKRKNQLLSNKERDGSPPQGENDRDPITSPNVKQGSTIGQNTLETHGASIAQQEQDKAAPVTYQKGQPLNRYKFRNANFFLQESKGSRQGDYNQIKGTHSKRNSSGLDFMRGISNYDFALKQKNDSGQSSQKAHHVRAQTNWNARRDLFSADRATRRPKHEIVLEKQSQDEQTNQIDGDNRSFIASHDYSRGGNQVHAQAHKTQFLKNRQKMQAQRPINTFGQQSNQLIPPMDRQMVQKKKSLLTMRDDSKSISDLANPNIVPQQLFDKSTKSIHTDKQALGNKIQLSRDNLDFAVPDYEDQFMDPNMDEANTGDPKTMFSKGNFSIFDNRKLKFGKQGSQIVRKSLQKGLTTQLPQTAPGEVTFPAQITPAKQQKKLVKPTKMGTEKELQAVQASQSPVNINTSNKNTFRQKLIKSINKDKAITKDLNLYLPMGGGDTKSVSDYCALDSMSPDVNFQNELADHLSNQIDQLRMQPILEDENEDGDDINRSKATQGKIALMHKEIKIINQVCQRLVTASDEYPSLYVGQPQDIELSPSVHLFYRFNLMGLPSPLKFEIEYHDNLKPQQSNLEIFLSTVDKNPDNANNEIKIYSISTYYLQADKIGQTSTENQLKEAEQNKKGGSKDQPPPKSSGGNEEVTFKDKYLYIGLNSYLGCSITLNIKNIVSRQTINKQKLLEYQKQRQIAYEFASNAFTEKDSYYREMKKLEALRMQELQEYRDKMKNGGFAAFLLSKEQRKQSIEQRKISKNERALEIIENHNQRDKEKQIRRIFYLLKWKKLRELAEDQYKDFRQLALASFWSTNFVIFIKTVHMIKQIWAVLQAKKKDVKMRQTAVFISIFLFLKQIGRRKKFGPDVETRTVRTVKNSISSVMPALYPVKYQTALEIVTPFIFDVCTSKELISKMAVRFDGLRYIQGKLNAKKRFLDDREKALRETVWVNECTRINNYLNEKKNKVAGKEEIIKKVFVVQQGGFKDFILTVYISRQKLESEIKFMEWYITMKQSEYEINPDKFDREKDPDLPYTKKFAQYKARLPVYKEVLKVTDQFLKKNLEKEKWITKMSRTTKPTRSTSKGKKVKKPPLNKLSSQNMATLIGVRLGTQIQKEEEKLGLYSVFNMPHSKFIQTDKPNPIVHLIVRAANLKEKAVKEFRTQFDATNCGTISWDFFREKEETRHKFRLDIIPECPLCIKEKQRMGEDRWRAERDKEYETAYAFKMANDPTFITEQH